MSKKYPQMESSPGTTPRRPRLQPAQRPRASSISLSYLFRRVSFLISFLVRSFTFHLRSALRIFFRADWVKNCSGGALLEGLVGKGFRQGLVRLDCPGGRECGCTFSSQPRFCPTCALVPLRKNPPEIRSNCLWSGSSGVFN